MIILCKENFMINRTFTDLAGKVPNKSDVKTIDKGDFEEELLNLEFT